MYHMAPIMMINCLYPVFFLLCYLQLRQYRDPIRCSSGCLHKIDACAFYVYDDLLGDPRLSFEQNAARKAEIAARRVVDSQQPVRQWLARNNISIRASFLVFEIAFFPVAIVHVCFQLQAIMWGTQQCTCEHKKSCSLNEAQFVRPVGLGEDYRFELHGETAMFVSSDGRHTVPALPRTSSRRAVASLKRARSEHETGREERPQDKIRNMLMP
jgi:hypothetical protein